MAVLEWGRSQELAAGLKKLALEYNSVRAQDSAVLKHVDWVDERNLAEAGLVAAMAIVTSAAVLTQPASRLAKAADRFVDWKAVCFLVEGLAKSGGIAASMKETLHETCD